MAKVIFDISMSLDGFMTAANVRPEEPLGDGGQRLHVWAMGDEHNRKYLEEAVAALGAVVAGRRDPDSSRARAFRQRHSDVRAPRQRAYPARDRGDDPSAVPRRQVTLALESEC
jgi:hypothetical protein